MNFCAAGLDPKRIELLDICTPPSAKQGSHSIPSGPAKGELSPGRAGEKSSSTSVMVLKKLQLLKDSLSFEA